MKALLEIVERHKRGAPVGIYALCSAHPLVIAAAMHEARARDAPLLIEATCNQVNQFGGYTGMTPAAFHRFVHGIARTVGLPPQRLWLGGDHLGPNAWRHEPAAVALARSQVLVAQYVETGFRKIHLDCSMACADDPSPLPEGTVAARAARLCAVAERTWHERGGEAPVYVIGTEVPTPGGALQDLEQLAVTSVASVETTLAAHRAAFAEARLTDAWSRVIALVVQPGVEFDHHRVVDYAPARAQALSARISADPRLVYEAHSTDYQTPEHLRALVRDHFVILKVGPGATFALRETLWALDAMESELPHIARRASLRETVLGIMRADPRHWRDHYRDRDTESFDLAYSLSDRIRYYWPHPEVQRACATLLDNLRGRALPMTLVSQYLPRQYEAVREGRLEPSVDALLRDGVAAALRPYLRACAA